MTETIRARLLIFPLQEIGAVLFGPSWGECKLHLRNLLRTQGQDEKPGQDQLLAFRFDHPRTALSVFIQAVADLRTRYHWPAKVGALPFKAALLSEAAPEEDSSLVIQWEQLDTAYVYIARNLLQRWEAMAPPEEVAQYQPGEHDAQLFRLALPGPALAGHLTLFPLRGLPVEKPGIPCFYCGMTLHTPARCPGKQLSLDIFGLPEAGKLPLDLWREYYPAAINAGGELEDALAFGLAPGELRRNSRLLMLATYFDLGRIFQLRFLQYLAAAMETAWPGIDPHRPDRRPDTSNFFMAMDCLRVGKYDRAKTLFQEAAAMPGRAFYAGIGLAFIALEEQGLTEMTRLLRSRADQQVSDQQTLYVNLLLARSCMLAGDHEAARQALQEVPDMYRNCPELQYLRLQVAVASGFTERQVNDLKKLCRDDIYYFLIALLDPLLIPVSEAADPVLSAIYQTAARQAAHALQLSRQEVDKLRSWFSEEDPELADSRGKLSVLDEMISQRGYFSLLEVAEKAKHFQQECNRAVTKKMAAFSAELRARFEPLGQAIQFWQQYPHQYLYQRFEKLLTETSEFIHAHLLRAQAQKTESQQEVTAVLEELQNRFREIARFQVRMERTILFKVFSRRFWISLVALELISLAIGAGVIPFFGPWLSTVLHLPLPAAPLGSLAQLRLLYFMCILISPAMAGLLALSAMLRK